MKIVFYGLPCAGKTTFINLLNLKNYKVLNGKNGLDSLCNTDFSLLNDKEKEKVRKKYAFNIKNDKSDKCLKATISFVVFMINMNCFQTVAICLPFSRI